MMKTKLGFALLALTCFGVVGVVLLSMGGSASASPGNAGSATVSSSRFGTSAFSALRPENWITPINVTHNPLYDNGPGAAGIAASQTDNSVTVVWGRADNSADVGSVIEATNDPLGSNFTEHELAESSVAHNGNARAKHDALGRRHVIWWQLGSTVCDYYARIEANGQVSVNEVVPGTCGLSRKNTALAVSPDGTVHAFFENNNLGAMYYYERTPAGQWVIQGEQVIGTGAGDITAGVSTDGVVMAAWKATSPGGNSDIYAATRNSNGTWTAEDISYSCCLPDCPTNSKTYLPALAADSSGGIRASWSDEHCDPRTDPNSQDIYYREWVPGSGWNNQPLVRVVNNIGYSYQSSIAVDSSGRAQIAWEDTVGTSGNFQLFYSSGRGTVFDAATIPFQGWGNFQKDIGIDTNPGYAHVTFGSDHNDSNKDNFYSYITTAPPITPTPTVSPTPCPPGTFSDVHPSDYFYTAVRDLAIRGIMSGYSDCTFRPYNYITRGQTAKIIVLGANIPFYTPPSPTFNDVPVTQTFYLYIESAYHSSIVSGYACGNPEPCPGLYYRPNNNVTRAQFAKMVVIAFGVTHYTPPTPTFRDVPSTHIFYLYIESAYHSGLISGYACGNPEPCPGLYYRPDNSITRGQAAKIIYGARQLAFSTSTATPTGTQTPVVVTATYTNTPIPTNTPVVVTATPTHTFTPTPGVLRLR